MKFVLERIGLDQETQKDFFKSAKIGNFDFLEKRIFNQMSEVVKNAIKKMLNSDPKSRVSSIQVLSMLKAPIPIISPKELQMARNEKPLGQFKMKTPSGRGINHPSFLSKRPSSLLKTPEILHDNFCSKVTESFQFPVLENSRTPQTVSQVSASSPFKGIKKSFFSLDVNSPVGNFFEKSREGVSELKEGERFYVRSKTNIKKVLSDLDLPIPTKDSFSSKSFSFEFDFDSQKSFLKAN